MSENILELHELDELKAAYNQMDERLEGQEIVSDENLREAMYNKFANLRQSAKEGLVYFNLIFVPVILWRDWSNQTITLFGTIVMTVYWVASLLFRMFILRKTKKEDYGTYDLKTLTEKEARYQKYLKWGNILFVLFWAAYFGQMLLVKGTTAFFVFLVLFLTLLMPVLIRYLIIKYKYNGEAIDPATGQPRKLTSTYFQVLGLVFLGIISCAILTMFVLGLIHACTPCEEEDHGFQQSDNCSYRHRHRHVIGHHRHRLFHEHWHQDRYELPVFGRLLLHHGTLFI